MNINDKYLPIGTVCILKGGTKRIMITGYCTISNEKPDNIFDYNGCPYPEGVVNLEKILLFNHDQIDKVYNLGYFDDDMYLYQTKLKELISKYESGELKKDDIGKFTTNAVNDDSAGSADNDSNNPIDL